MKRLVVNALYVGIAATLALGLAACNRSASADAGAASGSAAAPAPAAAPQAAGPKYAKVVSVTPIRKTVTTPHQVCKDVVVNHTAPPKDQHRIAGTRGILW